MNTEINCKFSKREQNAILRIARLVMEIASDDSFFDIEIDGRTGFVVVKKWKRIRDEFDVAYMYTWKPGIVRSAKGYSSLKDIQKWLQAEKNTLVEIDDSISKNGGLSNGRENDDQSE